MFVFAHFSLSDEEGESIVLLQWETHEGEFQTDTLKEQYFLKYHETYLEKFYGEEKVLISFYFLYFFFKEILNFKHQKQEEGFNYLWVLMIVIIGVVVIGGLVFFVIRMKKRSREAGVEHYGGFEDDENLDEADENFDEVDEDEF